MICYVADVTDDTGHEHAYDDDDYDDDNVDHHVDYYNVPESCPTNCHCRLYIEGHRPNNNLIITCRERHAVEPDTVLPHEIDVLLANNTQLKGLYIHHSSLTRVPAGVCNLTSVEVLRLDNNRLVALPDDCVSRLSQLRKFAAINNSISYLQVINVCLL